MCLRVVCWKFVDVSGERATDVVRAKTNNTFLQNVGKFLSTTEGEPIIGTAMLALGLVMLCVFMFATLLFFTFTYTYLFVYSFIFLFLCLRTYFFTFHPSHCAL